MAEIEHIDDEADGAGINFVKIDDKALAKEYGVFALPAVLFFRQGSKEPVIYAGLSVSPFCADQIEHLLRFVQIFSVLSFLKIWVIKYDLVCFPNTGDLYQEEQILSWLMTQKDPAGDVIEDIEGQRLIDLIEESSSMAVYFCKLCIFVFLFYSKCDIKPDDSSTNVDPKASRS